MCLRLHVDNDCNYCVVGGWLSLIHISVIDNDYIGYLPMYRSGILVADDNDQKMTKYLMVMNNNNMVDWTKDTDVDRFYELIVCNNVVKYYVDTMDKIDVDSCYNNNKIMLFKNEMCNVGIRLIFDDGG